MTDDGLTDDQLIDDLAALYRPVEPPIGGMDNARRAGQRRRRSRRTAFAATVTAVGVIAAGLLATGSFQPSSQPVRVHTGGQLSTPPATPPTRPSPSVGAEAPIPLSADPPYLLPPSTGSVTGLQLDRSAGDVTYQRLYLGGQRLNPAQLAIETIDLNQGRYTPSLLSAQNFSSTRTVQIGAGTATFSQQSNDVAYLWWKTTHGVEDDMVASGLSVAQLTAIAAGTQPSPGYRLGLSLPAALPGGLHQVGAALTRDPGIPVTREMYYQGGCDVELDLFAGFEAPGPVLGTTTVTTFAGGVAELDVITKNAVNPSSAAFLTWFPTPGSSAQLSTNGSTSCDPATFASHLHQLTTAQWDAAVRHLGSKVQRLDQSVAPPPSAPPTTRAP